MHRYLKHVLKYSNQVNVYFVSVKNISLCSLRGPSASYKISYIQLLFRFFSMDQNGGKMDQ